MVDFWQKLIFKINKKNDDYEYMTELLQKDKRMFRFASKRIKNDKDFIFTFLKKESYWDNDGNSIMGSFVDMHIAGPPRREPHKYYDSFLLYCSEELKKDKAFVIHVIKKAEYYVKYSGYFYKAIPIELRTDPNFWIDHLSNGETESRFLYQALRTEEVFKQILIDKFPRDYEERTQEIINQMKILSEKKLFESLLDSKTQIASKNRKI